MKRLLGIFGASGFGRETCELLFQSQANLADEYEVVFINKGHAGPVAGLPVMPDDWFFNSDREREFLVAIADPATRATIYDQAVSNGALPMSLVARNVNLSASATLGQGHIICPYASVTSQVCAGVGLHMNISSYLAHDSVIGDFVTISPQAFCGGNVVIGNRVFVGAGARIIQSRPGQKISIGDDAVIGMGAVVTKSVLAGLTVVGCPATILADRHP